MLIETHHMEKKKRESERLKFRERNLGDKSAADEDDQRQRQV